MTRRVTAVALLAALPTLLSSHFAGATETLGSVRTNAASSADSTVTTLPGGAILRLAPGTKIERLRTMKLQLAPPGQPQTVTQVVKLVSGRVDIEIPLSKAPKTAILLQMPHKVSAVAKGGHSTAIVDANRVTLAAVDGEMLAASGNDWKPLPSGLVRGFVGSDPTPQEHAVPGVPNVGISQPLLLSFGSDAPTAHANTAPVKDADHYQLSVWRSTENSHELVRRVDARGGVSDIAGLPPGQYQVTARAVDSSGIFGPESTASALRIVGADLPAGARYEKGSILLGTHSRVKLLGAAGLEATYGQSAHFVSAPDTVGLSRGEGTVLRLREPGSTSEVRVGLEPRTLRAEVEISPKHAHWPDDMIEVTVHLFDARGRAVSDSVKVKPTVLINVDAAAVTWARSGNTLHTSIPKPLSKGPWVVRVEVADEFGDPAGRDFMEVAGPDTDRVSSR